MTTTAARPVRRALVASAAVAALLLGLAAAAPAQALPPDAAPRFVQVDANRSVWWGGPVAFGVTDDGRVFSWGHNSYGLLGLGPTPMITQVPTEITFPSLAADDRIVQVSAGATHALAVSDQGVVYSWGLDDNGQLGAGVTGTQDSPAMVTSFPHLGGARIVQVSASGYGHSLAVSSSGQVYAWGSNGQGQLGDGTQTHRPTPQLVIPGGIAQVTAGNAMSHAVGWDGTVYAWGYNGDGRLGTGNTADRTSPAAISFPGLGGDRVVQVASGIAFGIALTEQGRIYTWGVNYSGVLGRGAGAPDTETPTLMPISGLAADERVIAVDAGDYFAIALTSEGRLLTWGDNWDGQLGLGDTVDRPTPTLVPASSFPAVLDGAPIAAIGAGDFGAVVASATGGVYAAGQMGGALGDMTNPTRPTRTFTSIRLAALSGAVELSEDPRVGYLVTAQTAGWNAGAVLSYEWLLDGDPIAGATDASYRPVSDDEGHELSVRVSATAENYGATTVTSTAREIGAAVSPTITTSSLPSIQAGLNFDATIEADGSGPYTFGATLPDGFTIDPDTGDIFGSTELAGEYPVTVTVTSPYGDDSRELTLVVTPGNPAEVGLSPSTANPRQGETITMTALSYDAYGNLIGDVTHDVYFTSDVDTDIVDGNSITFVHASPHTITAHYLEGMTGSIVIEVTPASAPAAQDELSGTGAGDAAPWVALAALSLLLGVAAVVASRRRHA